MSRSFWIKLLGIASILCICAFLFKDLMIKYISPPKKKAFPYQVLDRKEISDLFSQHDIPPKVLQNESCLLIFSQSPIHHRTLKNLEHLNKDIRLIHISLGKKKGEEKVSPFDYIIHDQDSSLSDFFNVRVAPEIFLIRGNLLIRKTWNYISRTLAEYQINPEHERISHAFKQQQSTSKPHLSVSKKRPRD